MGLGLSRWLRISDLISGLWIGALILALTLWSLKFLEKKIKLSGKAKLICGFLILVFIWALIFLPLYFTGIINKNLPAVLGLDYLTFSSFLGIIVSGLAVLSDKIIRKHNQGKVYFHYQRVILPLGLLILTSLILKLFC